MAEWSRVGRLNSLLKRILSDIVLHKVRNLPPGVLLTITRVEVGKGRREAKVYVSVMGVENKKEVVIALQSAAGFVSITAAKQVELRFFPKLLFRLDEGLDQQVRVDQLLAEIGRERQEREAVEGRG